MANTHLKRSFINTGASVVSDMLIDLLLNFSAFHSRCPSRTRINNNTRPPSFESFHPSINFSAAHTVIATPKCRHSLRLITKIGSQIVVVLWCIVTTEQPRQTCHSIATTQNTIKTNWVQVREVSHCLYPPPFTMLPTLFLRCLKFL